MSDPTPATPTPDSRREFLRKALRTAGYVPPAIIAMGMGNLAAAQASAPAGMVMMLMMMSDRDAKTAVAPVDPHDILERLDSVPVANWTYKADERSARHIGPMAQDFKKAFQVGSDERVIHAVDASGVALAAIQGLHQLVRDQQEKIAALESRLSQLEDRKN